MHGIVFVLEEIGAGFIAEEVTVGHEGNLRRNAWFATPNRGSSVDSSPE